MFCARTDQARLTSRPRHLLAAVHVRGGGCRPERLSVLPSLVGPCGQEGLGSGRVLRRTSLDVMPHCPTCGLWARPSVWSQQTTGVREMRGHLTGWWARGMRGHKAHLLALWVWLRLGNNRLPVLQGSVSPAACMETGLWQALPLCGNLHVLGWGCVKPSRVSPRGSVGQFPHL